MYDVDPNQTAQAEAYAEAALLAARNMRIPALQQYDAAEWGLRRLLTQALEQAKETTDYGLVLVLMDRAQTIDLAMQDIQSRRKRFVEGMKHQADKVAAQGVH